MALLRPPPRSPADRAGRPEAGIDAGAARCRLALAVGTTSTASVATRPDADRSCRGLHLGERRGRTAAARRRCDALRDGSTSLGPAPIARERRHVAGRRRCTASRRAPDRAVWTSPSDGASPASAAGREARDTSAAVSALAPASTAPPTAPPSRRPRLDREADRAAAAANVRLTAARWRLRVARQRAPRRGRALDGVAGRRARRSAAGRGRAPAARRSARRVAGRRARGWIARTSGGRRQRCARRGRSRSCAMLRPLRPRSRRGRDARRHRDAATPVAATATRAAATSRRRSTPSTTRRWARRRRRRAPAGASRTRLGISVEIGAATARAAGAASDAGVARPTDPPALAAGPTRRARRPRRARGARSARPRRRTRPARPLGLRRGATLRC